LILLITLKIGIAYGQNTTQDSCICYTLKQDKRSLECFINSEKKDTVINNQSKVIERSKQREEIKDEKISIQEQIIHNQETKIKRKNKNIIKMTLIALGVGVVAILK